MKPFDLEKALAGEPIKTIGSPIKKRVIGKSLFRDDLYIIEDEYSVYTFSLGRLQIGFEMWQEPRPRVQLDLPAPLEKVEEGQEVYYLEWGIQFGEIKKFNFNENNHCAFQLYKNGGLFSTKEDAKEWLDAMRNARR